jgi:hypothetical protein
MKTIYLDHNIAHYFVRGFPPNVDGAAERDALQKCLSAPVDFRFVLTDWHLVEAARECTHRDDPQDEGRRYADFFESLMPLFLDGHRALEKAEMATLAYSCWNLPTRAKPDWMFATEFSQIASSHIPEMLVGLTPRIYLRHLINTDSSRTQFHQAAGLASSGQQIAIDAYNDGRRFDLAIQQEINREWFLSLLPDRDLSNRWIELDRREQLADELSRSPDEVLRRCPAMFTESVITDIRAAAGGRKARPQDTFDLMHIIPSLAYCDAFVSNDAPLRKQAEEVCRRTGRAVATVSRLKDALGKLV